jgi:uncharacterized Tic20 family protein
MSMLTESARTRNERTNAALAHGGIILNPFSRGMLGIVLAGVIWFTQRDKSAFAARQAAQAFVYQLLGILVSIIVWLGWGILFAGSIVLPLIASPQRPEAVQPFTMVPAFVLMLVPFAVMIAWTVYGLYAALQVWNGRDFDYPLIGRLINHG